MTVWKADKFCAPANCFHTCPIGFKLSMVSGCATCHSDCLIDLTVASYVKGKGGTFSLPDVSASFILHLYKSTLYLFNGRMLICFLLCFLKLISTSQCSVTLKGIDKCMFVEVFPFHLCSLAINVRVRPVFSCYMLLLKKRNSILLLNV